MSNFDPPDRADILKAARECGLTEDNLVFSVDEEGVDNADVYAMGQPTDEFRRSVRLLALWAAATGAAIGIHFTAREAP
jgi:protein tyrosine phosphatase (PTP) superfamily phosphohydrolase (DUF442 family)